MISLKNIHIQYDKIILENESIDIPSGKVILLTGENGIGKTALLYRIGLISDDQQFIFEYNHQPITSFKEKEEFRQNYISFVLQDISFLPHYTVYDTLLYFAKLNNMTLSEHEINEMLKLVQLDINLNQNIMTLSLGEKQRLSIICVMMKKPTLMILDEPTASLDEENERLIFEILKQLSKKGITVFLTSHSPLAQKYADIIYKIENTHINKVKGEIVDVLQEIPQKSNVKDKFLKKYAMHYMKHYQFIYTFLIMILLLSMLLSSIFSVFIYHSKENDLKILQGYFDNKLVITKDSQSLFVNQSYTQYMNECHFQNAYPLYQMTTTLENKDISIVPYFESDQLDNHLMSYFSNDKNGIYMDNTTYQQWTQLHQNTINISILDMGIKHDVSENIKVNGVLKEGFQQHYSSDKQRFIYMPYHMMKNIYESQKLSNQYIGYVIVYDDFDTLKKEKEILDQEGFHINDSFTNIDSMNEIINYYHFVELTVLTLIILATLFIDVILTSHIHLQKRNENMILRITGLLKKHIYKIELYEYYIEICFTIFISMIISIAVFILAGQININSILIILFIDLIYFVIFFLERLYMMHKEFKKYTIEKVLRESEGM